VAVGDRGAGRPRLRALGERPGRRDRLARVGGRRRAWLADLLDGVGVLHELLSHPIKYRGAWLGTALYWVADITAFYAALRTFGLHLDVES
jgi:hypothetical protein